MQVNIDTVENIAMTSKLKKEKIAGAVVHEYVLTKITIEVADMSPAAISEMHNLMTGLAMDAPVKAILGSPQIRMPIGEQA